MKKKKPEEKYKRVTITLPQEALEFIAANIKGGMFQSTSNALARSIEDMRARIAEDPTAYTVKPVLPEKKPKNQ